MTRHTTFSFTLLPSREQEQALRRHVGAARFAFNQCLRLVLNALAAKEQADLQHAVAHLSEVLMSDPGAGRQRGAALRWRTLP